MHAIIANYNKIPIILANHAKMLAIGIKHHQRPIKNRAHVAQWLATGLWIRESWVQFPVAGHQVELVSVFAFSWFILIFYAFRGPDGAGN